MIVLERYFFLSTIKYENGNEKLKGLIRDSEDCITLDRGIMALALLAVGGLIGLYLFLMYGWISLNTPQGAPGYVLEEPLRQFFFGSIFITLVLFFPLYWVCRNQSSRAFFVLSLGFLMTIIGAIGMLIILPFFGVMSYPGGLTPDFGHTLSYENFTGALWLFLLFSGAVFYTSGHFTISADKECILCKLLPAVLFLPSYYLGAAGYDMISRISEEASLSGKFSFASIFALVVAVGTWIALKIKNK